LITFGWRYQKRGFPNPELDHLRVAPPKTRFYPNPETRDPNPEQIRQAQPFLWISPPFSRIMPDSTFYPRILKNGAQ
jgi:hypothetical protein